MAALQEIAAPDLTAGRPGQEPARTEGRRPAPGLTVQDLHTKIAQDMTVQDHHMTVAQGLMEQGQVAHAKMAHAGQQEAPAAQEWEGAGLVAHPAWAEAQQQAARQGQALPVAQ